MSLCQHLSLCLGNRKARDDRWVANPQDSLHLFEVTLSFCGGMSISRLPFLYTSASAAFNLGVLAANCCCCSLKGRKPAREGEAASI